MHFNVFSTGVKHGVASEVNVAHIVVEGSAMGAPRSFNIRLSHTASQTAIVAPLYSASLLDKATVGCFLQLQEIAPLPREKTNTDVDRQSAL